jgi:calcium permeable stress-gated cation channel
MLPDDEQWMGEEEDSEEEDYGSTSTPTLQRSQTMPIVASTSNGGDISSTSVNNPPLSTSRGSRYGTYFHHPERRRQQIPGAFPR